MIKEIELTPLFPEHIETNEMSVFITKDGLFRGALFNGTKLVNQMRAQHHLGILETLLLGQACLCASLLIQTMKGQEHIQFKYETDGPACGFCVESDSTGNVRGYLLKNPIPVQNELTSWDLEPFLGEGYLSIRRFPYSLYLPETQSAKKEPQVGIVDVKYKNIAKDLTWYFEQSEQLYTAFNTSIQFDKQGNVVGAGGLFIQKMPQEGGFSKKQILQNNDATTRMERAFSACPSLGTWFSEGGNREDIIYGLFREFDPAIALERKIQFNCPCSKERFLQSVKNIPYAELKNLCADNEDFLTIVCENCSSTYKIELRELHQ